MRRRANSKLVVTSAHLWAILGCILLRLALLPLQGWLAGRLELITRAQSWERTNEVVFRWRNGLDPFHRSAGLNVNPSLLVLRAIMPSEYTPNGEWLSCGWQPFILFIVVDIVTGLLLSQSSSIVLEEEEPMVGEKNVEALMEEKMKPNMAENNPLTSPKLLPLTVFCMYVLNPLTAALCVARGGDSIGYLLLALTLWTLHNGMAFYAGVGIAMCMLCYDARAVLLIISATVLPPWGRVYKWLVNVNDEISFRKKEDSTPSSLMSGMMATTTTTSSSNILFPFLRLWKLMSCLTGFFLAFGLAAAVAWAYTESLDSSISFLIESISVQDLTPTVGLHWYFFQQVFDQFRGYFCILLGWHMLSYMVPLTMRMAGDMPHAYIDTIAMIVTIFRPFPSFADLSVLICLGNSHPRVLGRMDWLTFITFGIGVPMFMIPAMLHVWLMAGTANANYLFFQALAYNLFLCLGLVQFINGVMKRRKTLQCAMKTRHRSSSNSSESLSKS